MSFKDAYYDNKIVIFHFLQQYIG